MRSAPKSPRSPKRRSVVPEPQVDDPVVGSQASAWPVANVPEVDAAPMVAARAMLAEAGLLSPPWDYSDLPTDPTAAASLEDEFEAWLDTLTGPLGLAAAVDTDRNE